MSKKRHHSEINQNIPTSKGVVTIIGDGYVYVPQLLSGAEAIYKAAREDRLEIVEALVEGGIDVDSRVQEDETPLIAAAADDNITIVKYLLEKGANVHLQSTGGYNAFMHACSKGWRGVAECLLKYGARINDVKKDGETALFMARSPVFDGDADMVTFLLERGIDYTICDKEGKTAAEQFDIVALKLHDFLHPPQLEVTNPEHEVIASYKQQDLTGDHHDLFDHNTQA